MGSNPHTHLLSKSGVSLCIFCKKALKTHPKCKRCGVLIHQNKGQDYAAPVLAKRKNAEQGFCDECVVRQFDDRKFEIEIVHETISQAAVQRWQKKRNRTPQNPDICYRCNSNPPDEGFKSCTACRQEVRTISNGNPNIKKRYHKLRGEHRCPTCLVMVNDGCVFCPQCRTAKYQKSLGRYWDQVRQGLCTRGCCQEPALPGKRKCKAHYEEAKEISQRHYKRNYRQDNLNRSNRRMLKEELHLCVYGSCQNKAVPGKVRCEEHLEKQRQWSKNWRDKQEQTEIVD